MISRNSLRSNAYNNHDQRNEFIIKNPMSKTIPENLPTLTTAGSVESYAWGDLRSMNQEKNKTLRP